MKSELLKFKQHVLNLGKPLTKAEQKEINGSHGGPCDDYTGPIIVTCEEYANVPFHHKICVMTTEVCG